MKISTITCHHVYNFGASLQAYGLQTYLQSLGYEYEIIDYRPDYLSNHYSILYIPNPRFRSGILKFMYLAAKFPTRYLASKSLKKKRFDDFESEYLKLSRYYSSYDDLKKEPPKSDYYIAGSDQIWNPLFQNGKDPAFFLRFGSSKSVRISYAPSLAVSELKKEDSDRLKNWISEFDSISVREKTAVSLLHSMSLNPEVVCDPAFLLNAEEWNKIEKEIEIPDHYALYYDFDDSEENWGIVSNVSESLPVISILKTGNQKFINFNNVGPAEFLYLIHHADLVISNSFHSIVFSLIFNIPFFCLKRKEELNSRIQDLLEMVGLQDRLLTTSKSSARNSIKNLEDEINWVEVNSKLSEHIQFSKGWLEAALKGENVNG